MAPDSAAFKLSSIIISTSIISTSSISIKMFQSSLKTLNRNNVECTNCVWGGVTLTICLNKEQNILVY